MSKWRTTEEIAEDGMIARECYDCHKVKKGFYWCGDWLCGRCIENSTIEGLIVDDRIVPRFSQEYQKLMKERKTHSDN